jgi:hypothetical protein
MASFELGPASVPASALRTMTWTEVWACVDEARACGDERALRAAEEELRRRAAAAGSGGTPAQP